MLLLVLLSTWIEVLLSHSHQAIVALRRRHGDNRLRRRQTISNSPLRISCRFYRDREPGHDDALSGSYVGFVVHRRHVLITEVLKCRPRSCVDDVDRGGRLLHVACELLARMVPAIHRISIATMSKFTIHSSIHSFVRSCVH